MQYADDMTEITTDPELVEHIEKTIPDILQKKQTKRIFFHQIKGFVKIIDIDRHAKLRSQWL